MCLVWVRRGGSVGSWWGNRRPLGRPRRRWVDNTRMDLQEVGCGYMDWIVLAQDRDRWRTLVSVVMNIRVPWNAGNFLTSCKPFSCSRRTLHHGVSKYSYWPLLQYTSLKLMILAFLKLKSGNFDALKIEFVPHRERILSTLQRLITLFSLGK